MIFALLENLRLHLENELAADGITFQLNYLPGRDVVNQINEDSIYITLLSISEDVSAKIPYVYHQNTENQYTRQNPPLVLDLSVMISSFFKNYTEGLKAISKVIQKLSDKKKFISNNLEYTTALYNISMEQSSNLWQALSTNILPNIIYKIRYIHIIPDVDENRDKFGEVVEIHLKTNKK